MMIEIIPNWHPVLVHFTIALLTTATGLFFLGSIFIKRPWSETILKTAHINLWIGAAITILTLLAGWDAYNTVAHDTASHLAMTDHRNWAFFTAGLFFVITIWSLLTYQRTIRISPLFLTLILISSGLLAATGYKGGELVYRHGLGVMSLPSSGDEEGHGSHSHGETKTKDNNKYQKSYYGDDESHSDHDHTH